MGNATDVKYQIKPTTIVLHGAMWTYTTMNPPDYSVAKETMSAEVSEWLTCYNLWGDWTQVNQSLNP